MRHTRLAGYALAISVAVTGLLAACRDAGPSCVEATTCVRIDVDGLFVNEIDQLQLDVVYADRHATTTTGTVGTSIDLPLSIPLTLDLPGSPLIEIHIIAAGKLGGRVVGVDAGSTTVPRGNHEVISLLLVTSFPCTEGALYCGGTTGLQAESESLYRCSGGVPIFYARCSRGCSPYFGEDAHCFGGGLCRDGGAYCGGNLLDGDPNTLYVCDLFDGTDPTPCPNGCLVRGDGADTCR
jgi:hypothetical protein